MPLLNLSEALFHIFNEVPKLPPVLAPAVKAVGPGDQRIDDVMPVGIPAIATPSDDVLLAFICSGGSDPISAPGGWTLGRQDQHTTGTRAGWWYKTCGGGDPGTTFNFTTPAAHECLSIGLVLQGVNLASPVFNHQELEGSGSGATPTALTGSPEMAFGLYLVATSLDDAIGYTGTVTEIFEVVHGSQRAISGVGIPSPVAGSVPRPTAVFAGSTSYLYYSVGFNPRPVI